jgi:trigger factor
MKRMQQGVEARDKILDELLERVEVPLPENVVQSEIDNRKHDAVHPFDHDEEAFQRSLEAEGKSYEEFENEVREEAEKSVRTQLLLDTVADEREVSVDDSELTERIIYQAQRFGVSPDEYVQRAQQSGQLGAIYADVRRGKALATIVRTATVTDGSGAPVDLSELFGTDEDTADAGGADEDTESGQATAAGDSLEQPAGDEAARVAEK